MLVTEYDDKRALIHTQYPLVIHLLSEGKIRNHQRVKEVARYRIRRARSVVESGMPSQLLRLYRDIYYYREIWSKHEWNGI